MDEGEGKNVWKFEDEDVRETWLSEAKTKERSQVEEGMMKIELILLYVKGLFSSPGVLQLFQEKEATGFFKC